MHWFDLIQSLMSDYRENAFIQNSEVYSVEDIGGHGKILLKS
jgi:hypothetical protein